MHSEDSMKFHGINITVREGNLHAHTKVHLFESPLSFLRIVTLGTMSPELSRIST